MRARRLLVALVTPAATVAIAAPAAAELRPGAGAYVNGGNPGAWAADHQASDGGRGAGGSGGGGGASHCEWHVAVEDDRAVGVWDPAGTRLYSATGRWLERWCDGGTVEVNGQFLVPQGQAIDPRQLALQAWNKIAIGAPPIGTSPEADRRLYVRVPTWLWVGGDWWQSYTASASAGRVTATVTARPTTASWSTGDGAGLSCAGPGVVWQRGMSDDATYCKHTYTDSSAGRPGGTYTLAVSVPFEVTWTSSVGAGGSLAGVAREASRAVEVGEIQAVQSG